MILARFILKVVGFRILAALAVLFAVLQVLDLLVKRCRELGMGVVIITHDLGVVANYCDRIAIMRGDKPGAAAAMRAHIEQVRGEYETYAVSV